MTGIYKITNTINGKCYIGQSVDLIKRIKKHIKTLINGTNRNEHLQNAYRTYGAGNFTIEIIEECDEQHLDEREIFWIDFYKSYDKNYGYNKTKGGKGGNGYLEVLDEDGVNEIKRKQSESHKGERNPLYNTYCYTDGVAIKYIKDEDRDKYESEGWRRGVPDYVKEKEHCANLGTKNGFYGKHHAKETREKLSALRSGENNWNFGKVIYHKGADQKYINPSEIEHYESLGWERGVTEENKRKVSKANSGRKMPESTLRKKSNIYVYNEQEYMGWRKLQAYLRGNGYPKISETAISKLSNGKKVRGYDELLGKIVKI